MSEDVNYTDILKNQQLAALRLEFEKACAELMLGTNADDDKRRQDLAKLMLSLAREPGATQHASACRPFGFCGSRARAVKDQRVPSETFARRRHDL